MARKYPSISLRQMEAIVFIIPQIFFATCSFETFPSIGSCDAFRPIASERKYLMDYIKVGYLVRNIQPEVVKIKETFRPKPHYVLNGILEFFIVKRSTFTFVGGPPNFEVRRLKLDFASIQLFLLKIFTKIIPLGLYIHQISSRKNRPETN